MIKFSNRTQAGQKLARLMSSSLNDNNEVIVLGLARGGLPVAAEVARHFNARLDLLTVRKLGVPGHEELAFGAIAPDGIIFINRDILHSCRITPDIIKSTEHERRHQLEKLQAKYRAGLPRISVKGKTVVIVDDGLATGATMRAALQWAKSHGAALLIAACPVASADTCREIESLPECDACICCLQPENLGAVGIWYDDFSQVSDEMVCKIMQGN